MTTHTTWHTINYIKAPLLMLHSSQRNSSEHETCHSQDASNLTSYNGGFQKWWGMQLRVHGAITRCLIH